MFLFSKCRPTNTSSPQTEDEEQHSSGIAMTRQFTRLFVPSAASAEQVEPTEPYKYIKEGNIEKLLDALHDHKLHPGFAWQLAIKHPRSPALFLFIIAKLPTEDLRQQIVFQLQELRDIKDELPGILEQCYAILGQRSAQAAWDYGTQVMESLNNLKGNILRDAVLVEGEKTNEEWQAIHSEIFRQRLQLHKPTRTENFWAKVSKACCSPTNPSSLANQCSFRRCR